MAPYLAADLRTEALPELAGVLLDRRHRDGVLDKVVAKLLLLAELKEDLLGADLRHRGEHASASSL